jgi:hypothetical protein
MDAKPPKLAFDLEHDLRALSAMASHLTPYLYENEMYGVLPGNLPRLTLGGLLLRLYRFSRLTSILTAQQQAAVQEAQATFDSARAQWAAHYDKKVHHELRARLDAFSYFLDDCTEDRRGNAVNYPAQAEKRIMIEHLRQEAEARHVITDVQYARLKEVDQRLSHLFKEGALIMDERLASVYPRGEFWWLYGSIPESNS